MTDSRSAAAGPGPQPEVVTFGEAMISFRAAGPLELGQALTPGLAGAESNVAIGLARLGHRVSWVGRLGADRFGELALRELRAEGVDVTHVAMDAGAPTGLMFLEQRTTDISAVEYRRAGSAGSCLSRDDLVAALAARPRIVHVTGITPALSSSALDAWGYALGAALPSDTFVSLDVNHRARLWDRPAARDALRRHLHRADLVVASDDELDLVADGDEQAAVESLLELGVAQVAVKRGAGGASLWTHEGRIDCPALPVTAVDTVGAGDAFCAGFLSGLLDDLGPQECLHRATLLGAWAVSTRGDWQGLPRRDELDLLRLVTGTTLR